LKRKDEQEIIGVRMMMMMMMMRKNEKDNVNLIIKGD
jgi:hypothetical protein